MSTSAELIQPDRGQAAVSIHLVDKDGFATWARRLTTGQRATLEAQKFDGGGYQVGIVPDGESWFAVGGVADPAALSSWCLAKLSEALPAGTYRLAEGEPGPALFGWQTAQYRFSRYREDKDAAGPRVLLTKDARAIEPSLAEARAACKVMDLVNTPAEDMGPAALEAEAEALAKAHKAQLSVTRGEALEREYPMVHAVGRGAARGPAPPRVHPPWGPGSDPGGADVGHGGGVD
jgi:leucyl aminopeptidase